MEKANLMSLIVAFNLDISELNIMTSNSYVYVTISSTDVKTADVLE